MITRPPNLLIIEMRMTFNNIEYEFLEIDIDHINKGKDKSRNSDFSIHDIILIFRELVNDTFLKISGTSEFENEYCSYFVKTGNYAERKFRVVFCVCSDRPTTLGIITLFRVS